jgi:16S rRNA G966 N2-methylase RsmD
VYIKEVIFLNQIKRTASQKRELIAERLKHEPCLSDRAVGRQLNVSPHTVAKVRTLLGIERPTSCANAQGGTGDYNWLEHPWIQENKHIIDTIKSPRALRAIKSSPEVIEVMKERKVGAVRAQQLINLQRKAEIKASNGICISDKDIHIKEDDIRTGLEWIPSQSCNIVCVDPPYAKEYIDLYEAISKVSSRILKPNGHLLVLTGCAHLPAIMEAIERGANKTNLRYKWTMSVQLPRSSPTSVLMKGLITSWKPIIVYKKKGPRLIKPRLVHDVIEAPQDKDDKSLHKWQQSELVFIELLNRYKTNNSDFVVADLCCGSGTTLTSAIKIGATAVYGCDVDAKSMATTNKRIKEVMYGKGE